MFALNHEGNEAIVKYLINNHADPNKADNSGITPLHMAATQGFFCPCICLLCNFYVFFEFFSFNPAYLCYFHTVGSFFMYLFR